MSVATERVVKALAASAASVLPALGDIPQQNDVETLTAKPMAAEVCDIQGIEEAVMTVECDFPGWFREQMNVPGTDVVLRFNRRPLMQLHCGKGFAIPDWGVTVPLNGISEEKIRLEVVKEFLRLHRAEEKQCLSDSDRVAWEHFVRDVDYADYCEQIAPPVWSVGRKVRTTKDGVEIAWSSSDHEVVTGGLAEQLSVVSDGERFGALTRFASFKLSYLSDVAQLGHYDMAEDDLSWLS